MYDYVRQFIRDLVKVQLHHLRPLGGTILLSEYVRRWKTTMTYVHFMKRVLHHLQRFWILENANTHKEDPIRPLDKLLMFYWREDLLSSLPSIVDIALSLVDEDRRGNHIDDTAVRGIVDNFVEIGAADLSFQDSERASDSAEQSPIDDLSTLQLYIQVFEHRFLARTRKFYKEEGALMAHKKDVSMFINQVKELLDDEEKRARLLLHQDSIPRVRRAVEEQLIGNHKRFLQQHANNMIEKGSEDDLRLVYNLLDRITGAMDPVRAFFVRFVRNEGNNCVASHLATLNGKEDIRHNLVLVELLVRLYLKHANMVKRCFDGANKIMLAIDDAFRGFVNRSLGAVSLPNLLAHYIDQLLKRKKPAGSLFLKCSESQTTLHQKTTIPAADQGTNKTSDANAKVDTHQPSDCHDDPRARHMNELVRILMYLDNKDMFFETHRRLFGKRLLADHDEDMETLFITKLREQMGTTYTQRLSGMLQDIKISNTLREDFASFLSRHKSSSKQGNDDKTQPTEDLTPVKLKIDFNAHVLNALHWPSVKVSDLIIPDVLQHCQKTFSDFYMQNTETRKLTWIHSMSTVHVRANWGNVMYMFVVSTFQASTLILFNDAAEISLSEASRKLNVTAEDLKRHIKPLLEAKKSKILTLFRRPSMRDRFSSNAANGKTHEIDGSNLQEKSTSVQLFGQNMENSTLDVSGSRQHESSKKDAGVVDGVGDGAAAQSGTNGDDSTPCAIRGDAKKRELMATIDSESELAPEKKKQKTSENRLEGSVKVSSSKPGCTPSDIDGQDHPNSQTPVEKRETAYEEVLRINLDFVSKQHRIVVPSLMPRLATAEATVSRKNVVIDRSTQVDAEIMRIMKLRKRVSHTDLCAKVIEKMSALMFTPDVKLIKVRLDRLIDQDYIVRDEKDARVYKYNT